MLSKRQFSILNRIITSPEPMQIKELATAEGVTLQTIYNDLQLLEKLKISVSRGNVGVVTSENQNSIIQQKIFTNRALREKACDCAIEMIFSQSTKGSLFIDGGSTGYIFFERLLMGRMAQDLTIITNNPLVIGAALNNQDFFYQNSIFAMGGKLDPTRISLYSLNQRASFPYNINELPPIDICILGFRAISSAGELFIANEEEINQKKSLIGKSRELILITSPDKLGTTSLFKIASLSKEIQSKNKKVIVIAGVDGSLTPEASTTLQHLAEVLGESSVRIV